MEDFNGADYAIRNLETIAHNIAAYASYRGGYVNDIYGEIDDSVQNAENAVLELCRMIERLKD